MHHPLDVNVDEVFKVACCTIFSLSEQGDLINVLPLFLAHTDENKLGHYLEVRKERHNLLYQSLVSSGHGAIMGASCTTFSIGEQSHPHSLECLRMKCLGTQTSPLDFLSLCNSLCFSSMLLFASLAFPQSLSNIDLLTSLHTTTDSLGCNPCFESSSLCFSLN